MFCTAPSVQIVIVQMLVSCLARFSEQLLHNLSFFWSVCRIFFLLLFIMVTSCVYAGCTNANVSGSWVISFPDKKKGIGRLFIHGCGLCGRETSLLPWQQKEAQTCVTSIWNRKIMCIYNVLPLKTSLSFHISRMETAGSNRGTSRWQQGIWHLTQLRALLQKLWHLSLQELETQIVSVAKSLGVTWRCLAMVHTVCGIVRCLSLEQLPPSTS